MDTQSRRAFLFRSTAGTALVSCGWCAANESYRDPYAEAILVDGPPPVPDPESFTVVVLPDTQHYSERFPMQFLAQTRWILEYQIDRRIVATLHLGDITNRNSVDEWKVARDALSKLDGKMPWFLCPGNHDYSVGGSCRDRTTRLNEFFPVAERKKLSPIVGVFDDEPNRLDNNYGYFQAAGRRFLVLALEFGPRRAVVEWAKSILARHKDHEAILITHAFVYSDETRYDWKTKGSKQAWNPHSYAVAKASKDDVMDGEELWQNLITEQDQFILTLNGHVLNDGLSRVISPTPRKREVPQLLVNFQMKPQGGDGWLRLLEFTPDRQIKIYDYSPTRNQHNVSSQNQFSVKTPPLHS